MAKSPSDDPGVESLRADFPNLIVGLKTTVLPFTVDDLDAIVRYAREYNLFTIISPCIITEGRYLNPDRAMDLAFNSQQTEKMIRFYQNDSSRWSFHDTCLVRYLKTGRMKKPCSCGFNYFFIRSQGSLLPCPMIDESPGNITQTPIEELLASDTAVRIRRHAGKMDHAVTAPNQVWNDTAFPVKGGGICPCFQKWAENGF
jgi:MoaA/NifB/PqqE/SkfB family radical SAM enzyme